MSIAFLMLVRLIIHPAGDTIKAGEVNKMSFEQQLKAETGLPDKHVEMLLHYIRFLQSEYREEQARETAPAAPIRKAGRYQGKGWMADDFDAPLDDPWASVRSLIGTFPKDFMSDREQPAWDAVTKREGL